MYPEVASPPADRWFAWRECAEVPGGTLCGAEWVAALDGVGDHEHRVLVLCSVSRGCTVTCSRSQAVTLLTRALASGRRVFESRAFFSRQSRGSRNEHLTPDSRYGTSCVT